MLLEAGVAADVNGATALHVAALGVNRSEATAAHLLGGSWVVISGVISRATIHIRELPMNLQVPVLRFLVQAGAVKALALTHKSGRTTLDDAFKVDDDNAEMVQLPNPPGTSYIGPWGL